MLYTAGDDNNILKAQKITIRSVDVEYDMKYDLL